MTALKVALIFLVVVAAILFGRPTKADLTDQATCTTAIINSIYIPKLRPLADWTDDQLRPYAKQLCQLDVQKSTLQTSIKNQADHLRTTNWRICKEVIPGNPNPTDAECKSAHANLINGMIDECILVINLGHNPHNVMLLIDPLKVEVACLSGVDTSLK